MVEKNVPAVRRHDDFHEIFMEQRVQKLNNPEQLGIADSPISSWTSSYSSGYTSTETSH